MLTRENFKKKLSKSNQIINEVYEKYKNKLALVWTGGKDSTVVLHMVKVLFNDNIPFPVVFNDSTMEYSEVYDFIEKYTKLWKLNLIVTEHLKKDLNKFYKVKDIAEKKKMLNLMKTNALDYALRKYNLKGFIDGIRQDKCKSRSEKKYIFFKGKQVNIHPILHFEESDIWDYIKKYNVPYVSLHERYRFLTEKPYTKRFITGKRKSGRDIDREMIMRTLRKMGYW